MASSQTQAVDHQQIDPAEIKRLEYENLKRKTVLVGIGIIPFAAMMVRMITNFLGITSGMFDLGVLRLVDLGLSFNVLHVIQFVLSTPILFIGGSQFFSSAWNALKIRTANMDTLVAMGTFTAWFFSSIVTFAPGLFTSADFVEVK